MRDATASETPKRPGRKRRLWTKRLGCGCLTFVVTLALGLVITEWLLRAYAGHFLGTPGQAFRMYEMDDENSFRLTPGWTGEQTVDGRVTSIRINSLGLRGPEIQAKAVGEKRVLMIGDSMVFGMGVSEHETIPAQLQRQLRANGLPSATVVNGGVPGHGHRDATRRLERLRDLDPDLIIVTTYLENDFNDDCRLHTAITEGFLLFGPVARLAHTSTRFRMAIRFRTVYLFERLLLRFVPSLALDPTKLGQTPQEIEAVALFPPESQRTGGLYFDRIADDALVTQILDRCRTSYRTMQKLAGETPILLVLIPSKWHVMRETWTARLTELGLEHAKHEFGRSQRRLAELAGTLGLAFHDLTPDLSLTDDPLSFWLPVDRHFSAKGCTHVATRLQIEVSRLLGK